MEWQYALLTSLALLNVVSLALFAFDKMSAVRHGRRIRESTLLALALVGPFGACGAMRLFHHKTRKLKFALVYVFMGLHLAVAALLIYYYK